MEGGLPATPSRHMLPGGANRPPYLGQAPLVDQQTLQESPHQSPKRASSTLVCPVGWSSNIYHQMVALQEPEHMYSWGGWAWVVWGRRGVQDSRWVSVGQRRCMGPELPTPPATKASLGAGLTCPVRPEWLLLDIYLIWIGGGSPG